ncbi:hypothetical protein M3Y97_00576700 [Aphelenchoides bicaudatus]|nr:hypothetical protein M3Y97_00576700 [Aphelenchoides bicaudatus]
MRQFTQQPSDLNNYRQLCEARLKRLERYKKTKSFFSLDNIDNEASTSFHLDNNSGESRSSSANGENNQQCANYALPQHRRPYELLKEKMTSLMETDIQLLQKLLHLADTIDTIKELREKPLQRQRSSSETSISSGNCEDDENEDELRPMADRFSVSTSAITHLYVHDAEEAEIDESENQPNFQYFSRKNSVLRIPIPARASNRILGKKIPRRPSELLRPRLNKNLHVESSSMPSPINKNQSPEKPCQPLQVDDTQTSGHTSPTSSHSQHSPDNQSTLSSCCSNERKTTLSAASIDSGIRDDENSSPIDPKQV